MIKGQAIEDAQSKANLSKKNQVVFTYIGGVEVLFDYTHEHLWERRHFRVPITTKVVVVTPDTARQRKG